MIDRLEPIDKQLQLEHYFDNAGAPRAFTPEQLLQLASDYLSECFFIEETKESKLKRKLQEKKQQKQQKALKEDIEVLDEIEAEYVLIRRQMPSLYGYRTYAGILPSKWNDYLKKEEFSSTLEAITQTLAGAMEQGLYEKDRKNYRGLELGLYQNFKWQYGQFQLQEGNAVFVFQMKEPPKQNISAENLPEMEIEK